MISLFGGKKKDKAPAKQASSKPNFDRIQVIFPIQKIRASHGWGPEATEKKYGESGFRHGEEVLQVRIDQITETNPSRRKKFPGIRFVPPFTLHPNAEDQNTYRKLMVAMGQRMRDDSRPDEEKNKLAGVQESIRQRREETKGKYVNENLKAAFAKRREAKKREDMQGG